MSKIRGEQPQTVSEPKMSDLIYNLRKNDIERIINVLSSIPYFGFDIKTRGEIPDEPLILAINHKLKILVNPFLKERDKRTRYIDHFFVGVKYPKQIHFMVQDIQYMKPATRKYLEGIEALPVHDLRKGLEFLSKGETLAIFPEGEAHLMEEDKFYKGMVWLSAKSQKRILPVYVSKNSKEVNNILHPKLNRIYIDYLIPLDPPATTKKVDLDKKVQEFKRVLDSHKESLSCLGQY